MSLDKKDIPDRLPSFAEGLEKIFGQGAQVVEKAIIKSLCRKLGVREIKKPCEFVECVNYVLSTAGSASFKQR
ncbi:MAG: hypothetical protein QHH24_01815 [Candidatus Bathyarchaeota archaeon]|nr:hypothetical protein [Candidatus Bathyarchaeota archaeon]